MGGTPFCWVHGGDKSPERRARSKGLGAAKRALGAARADLGGTYPRDLLDHPAWRKIPGDMVATTQKRADLARAWATIPDDDGKAWRATVARYGDGRRDGV